MCCSCVSASTWTLECANAPCICHTAGIHRLSPSTRTIPAQALCCGSKGLKQRRRSRPCIDPAPAKKGKLGKLCILFSEAGRRSSCTEQRMRPKAQKERRRIRGGIDNPVQLMHALANRYSLQQTNNTRIICKLGPSSLYQTGCTVTAWKQPQQAPKSIPE